MAHQTRNLLLKCSWPLRTSAIDSTNKLQYNIHYGPNGRSYTVSNHLYLLNVILLIHLIKNFQKHFIIRKRKWACPPRCVLDRSVHQPTQWTVANVAYVSFTHLGGPAHRWCLKGQISKTHHTWWHVMATVSSLVPLSPFLKRKLRNPIRDIPSPFPWACFSWPINSPLIPTHPMDLIK